MERNKTTKPIVKKPIEDNTPKHLKEIVLLLNNNSEIRRYTSKGMIAKLKQLGQIPKDSKAYIKFSYRKFSVSVDGLKQEFYYNNSLFTTCLTAAFPAFASNAINIIKTFCEIEHCSIDNDEVNNIVELLTESNSSPVEE